MQSARASLDELRMLETGDEALKQALAFASQLHALAPVDPSTDLHAVDREAIAVALDAARSAPGHRAPRNVIDEIVGARTGVDGLRGAARALTELSELLTTPAELAAWSELQRKRIETLDALARAELELRTGSGSAPLEATPTQRTMIEVAIERLRRDRTVTGETISLLSAHASVIAAHDRVELAATLLDMLAGGLDGEAAAALAQSGRHAAAIEIYGELSRVLSGLRAPAVLRDGTAPIAFLAAQTADARARAFLAHQSVATLDESTKAAIDVAMAAYANLVTTHPRADELSLVLGAETALAVAVAQHGAWGEAQRLFATLIAQGVHRVDQPEFCRALCMLGPVMADPVLPMLIAACGPAQRTASSPHRRRPPSTRSPQRSRADSASAPTSACCARTST